MSETKHINAAEGVSHVGPVDSIMLTVEETASGRSAGGMLGMMLTVQQGQWTAQHGHRKAAALDIVAIAELLTGVIVLTGQDPDADAVLAQVSNLVRGFLPEAQARLAELEKEAAEDPERFAGITVPGQVGNA